MEFGAGLQLRVPTYSHNWSEEDTWIRKKNRDDEHKVSKQTWTKIVGKNTLNRNAMYTILKA